MTNNILRKSFLFLLIYLVSCTSYEQFKYITDEFEIPSQVYNATYAQTWQAVIQFAKKYDLAVQNQEAGIIKTRDIDNTLELNFTDSFGSKDSVKSAKFKVIINVVKGYRGNKEITKVTIFKRQMVEQDFLQGYKVIASDGIFEKVALYRIGKILSVDNKIQNIEKVKQEEDAKKF
ncbi:MAG: hypothetical protein A2202_04635 [Bdellovibrionales bacterium RIFOXYA1_FULL_36_14]|nr:MAG: hypothetical protein A2202_04635 [Bdellovibrionales bacterium RIFOXYA1_FULL_36_14]